MGAFWRRHGAALAAFLVLTAVFTCPAVLRLGTHAVGTGDVFAFVWEFWWFHRALFELHVSPLSTTLLFFPGPPLPMIWSAPLMVVAGMVLTGAVGPVAAYNLLVLGAVALAGWGAYMLAHALVGRRDAAFLAGTIYAFGPAHLGEVASGHLANLSIFGAPFFALALIKLWEKPGWGRALALALATAAVVGADLYMTVYFLPLFVGLFALHGFLTHRDRLMSRAFWPKALAGLGLGTIVTAPFHLPTLIVAAGAKTTALQGATADRFSQDLLQLVLPPASNPLLGFLARPMADRFAGDLWGYLGWTAIALAAIAVARRQPGSRFWLAFTALAVVFALGPVLHVAGYPSLPLPYAIATHLPLLSAFRAPERFAMYAALGLGVLAAMGASLLLARFSAYRRRAFAVLLALVFVECLSAMPFPTRTAAVPDYYRTLAQAPRAGAILELPAGDPTWGVLDHQWMYYQTLHRHPLVNGHTHRIPDANLAFLHHEPVVKALTSLLATGGELRLAPALAPGASAKLAQEGIGRVIVHAVPGMLEGDRYDKLAKELAGLFGPPVYRTATMAVFLTGAPAPAAAGR